MKSSTRLIFEAIYAYMQNNGITPYSIRDKVPQSQFSKIKNGANPSSKFIDKLLKATFLKFKPIIEDDKRE